MRKATLAMSLHFEKVNIKKIKKETEDCVSVLFDIPANLQQKFLYRPGQHFTIRSFINGEEQRRSYSLCSAPLENEWRIAIKKVDGGIFSSFANEKLKEGDTLELMPPMGHFTLATNKSNQNEYVAFAAGSGITPIISMIKTALAEEPESNFTLVYGNRNRQSIIFKEELEGLKNKYINRFRVIYILSREKTDAAINQGRIDTAKCSQLFEKLISKNADAYFLCGPEEMIFCVKDFLLENGVHENKIHFELFTTPGQKSAIINRQSSIVTNGPASQVTVKLDGRSFSFPLAFDGEAILDAALKQGADLPYACKGGVCCTCKAKLLKGEVDMDVHYGLEPEEIEQGFILTCQSHPRTEFTEVDFDLR